MKYGVRTLVCMLALALAIPSAVAQETGDHALAWERLKTLAGTWTSHREGRGPRLVTFHLTSQGTVLLEEFHGDSSDGVRSMATAYHVDVDTIVATHYCSSGNQPRMRLASYDPVADVVRLDFWDITHLPDPDAYYTSGIDFRFLENGEVELGFRGMEAGQATDVSVHRLVRLAHAPTSHPTS